MSRSPIHVCSLSMSPLTNVRKELARALEELTTHDSEETADPLNNPVTYDVNRLRWVELSIEYNRQVQLQSVFQQLGNKGNSPRFRAVRMKPLFNAWKREILRANWRDVREALDSKALGQRLDNKKEKFAEQRAELTARSFAQKDTVKEPEISGLVNYKHALEILDSFQTPASVRPGFDNQFLDYCASSAVTTISEVPPSTADEDWAPGSIKSRGLDGDSLIDDEVPLKSAAERSATALENQKATNKSNSLKTTIIVVAVLIAIIAVFLILTKGFGLGGDSDLAKGACPDATPVPSCATPKKGWF